jgi:hypothetical protein
VKKESMRLGLLVIRSFSLDLVVELELVQPNLL